VRGLAVLLSAAATIAASGAAVYAHAETVSHDALTLEWEAPPGCPGARATLDRIESLLGDSPGARERVQARGSVRRSDRGVWELSLETAQSAQRFERSVRAESCEEVTEAGALIIALAIAPNLSSGGSQFVELARQPESSESPSPKPPATVAPTPEEPARSTEGARADAESRAKRAAALRVVAAALCDVGTLPRPALGAELGAALSLRPLYVEVVGTVLPDARETIADDRGGDISLLGGGVRVCYAAQGGRLSGRACAGAEFGRLQGTGVGASWSVSQDVFWSAGRVGVAGSYAFSSALALRAGIEALVPVSRPEFILENVGPVHQPAAVAGRLAVGLELSF
jgi:hypothetical protein